MADHAGDDEYDGDVFIYRGGRAPQHITHARIHESADEVEEDAFNHCENLLTVDTHDGLRRIGPYAFNGCKSLRRINLKPAVDIFQMSFKDCENLESVEFGDRLGKVCGLAFEGCASLNHLNLPTITTISFCMFRFCKRLTTVQLSERLEIIWPNAFTDCKRLQRITVPLKRDLLKIETYFDVDRCMRIAKEYNQFDGCGRLTTVNLVGGVHKTVASLHMESWRTEMTSEINRINQVLPTTPANEKTDAIQQWMESLLDKLDHYKAEHNSCVKEATALLELALWKANLKENWAEPIEMEGRKMTRGRKRARKKFNVTSGANVVIRNVLPFLQLN